MLAYQVKIKTQCVGRVSLCVGRVSLRTEISILIGLPGSRFPYLAIVSRHLAADAGEHIFRQIHTAARTLKYLSDRENATRHRFQLTMNDSGERQFVCGLILWLGGGVGEKGLTGFFRFRLLIPAGPVKDLFFGGIAVPLSPPVSQRKLRIATCFPGHVTLLASGVYLLRQIAFTTHFE